MKKVVLKVEVFDEKIKQKAMKTVSGLEGLESIDMNMKDMKLTLIGEIDPVTVVAKLRKVCSTHIFTVGPAKEENKKEEPKKTATLPLNPMSYYHHFHPPPMYNQFYKPVVEENPNDCVIC